MVVVRFVAVVVVVALVMVRETSRYYLMIGEGSSGM